MDAEQKALLTIAVLAARCDNQQSEAERLAIANVALGDAGAVESLVSAAQSGSATLESAVAALITPENRNLAYAAATAVCNADGASNAEELKFLESLRVALGLGVDAQAAQNQVSAIASAPLGNSAGSVPRISPADMDKMIFDAAVLNGALELLPDTLASMAILPLQMKLVYRIGKAHNFDLGREHIRDFVATLGVGLTAQYLEGFARKLLGGLLGGLGRQTASSGMAFLSTYAIGRVAQRYYAGGRTLDATQLKETYQSMYAEAKSLLSKAQAEIQSRMATIRTGNIADLVKSS